MDVDVVEAGILIRPDLVQVALRIGSADDQLGHVIFANGRGRLFEMGGQLELLSQLARYAGIGPDLVCGLARRGLISGPAHGYLSIARLAPSARVLEKTHGLLVRLGGDVTVPDLASERARFPSATVDHDWWRLRRPGVDPSIFDGVVPSAVTDGLATPQQSDQADRLFEHLESDVWLRPVLAQDVLIQVFAGSQPQKESSRHHGGGARRRVGDDGGMRPHQWTGDARAKSEARRRFGNAANHAPDERALTLPVRPRMKVVGDERNREADLFGAPGLGHQFARSMLFAGERITDFKAEPYHGVVAIQNIMICDILPTILDLKHVRGRLEDERAHGSRLA